MMLNKMKNSKKQGDVGLGEAIAWFAKNGITVCVPLTDSQDFDLVVDIDGVLKKIQVKTTTCISNYGIYKLNIKVCGGNKSGNTVKHFDNKSVDFVFALTMSGEKYLIPSEEITSKSELSLGASMQKFKVD